MKREQIPSNQEGGDTLKLFDRVVLKLEARRLGGSLPYQRPGKDYWIVDEINEENSTVHLRGTREGDRYDAKFFESVPKPPGEREARANDSWPGQFTV